MKGKHERFWRAFRYAWYLFWPVLYALSLQWGVQGQVARLMVIALVATAAPLLLRITAGNFDPEERKAYYQDEGRNIDAGKGSYFGRTVFWTLPILAPLLCWFIPWLIASMGA
ncbi:hypothetical protein LI291_08485 [Intestinibacillus massiliensis]|uniref:hypothetical protein n=1 Tax=Intestinibacillus massiliensis TaxID=1871029 RepID=UPI000B353B39|nr:hypothetical protein [Intestinibacillus massiliensis]MCB6366206.1 hypothetical protein [Intestinibacillus massiliensis]